MSTLASGGAGHVAWLSQFEMGGEFAATKVGLSEALALLSPASKHAVILPWIVVALSFIGSGRLLTGLIGQAVEFEAGLDDVIHITEGKRIALPCGHPRPRWVRACGVGDGLQLVATETEKLDGVANRDAADIPPELRPVENRFKDAPGSRGRGHGVAHPFDLHFGRVKQAKSPQTRRWIRSVSIISPAREVSYL